MRIATRDISITFVSPAVLSLFLISCVTAGDPAPDPTPAQDPPAGGVIEGVHFSSDDSLMFLTPEKQRVAYRNVHLLAPANLIERGGAVSSLPPAAVELKNVTYDYLGRARSLEDFMTDTNVAGLLVLRDGGVVLEKYAHGHGPASLWTSFSVAKSVVSLLYGAALADGSIRSLDDSVSRYLPELAGSEYDSVTLRHLLQMSSGIAWDEGESDPDSNLSEMVRIGSEEGIGGLVAYMKTLPRQAPSGTVFNYNTGETYLAGAVLSSATGQSLADYLSRKLWKPAGMESDAHWLLLRPDDAEHGGCCISATLRDYGRLGLLAMRDGVAPDGTRVIPAGWISESTAPSPNASYYGYLWWLGEGGRFAASGSFGQYIHIDPANQLVVVTHSLWPDAFTSEQSAHRRAFLDGVTRAVSQMTHDE